jgi:hypothetical protein
MKAFLLFTASGPVVILSSHATPADEVFVGKLRAKGVDKFLAFELPWEEVREKYGGHFQVVLNDLRETDDLRILDFNGQRVFQLFRLDRLGDPQVWEPEALQLKVYMD